MQAVHYGPRPRIGALQMTRLRLARRDGLISNADLPVCLPAVVAAEEDVTERWEM